MKSTRVSSPRQTIDRCTLIAFVPTIRYPLVNAAASIVRLKGLGLKASDLHRLRGIVGFIASLAVRHTSLELITPPIFCLRAPSRRVLPFGFARKPVSCRVT